MNRAKDYARFKLQWMLDHNYTLDDLINELELLRQESPNIDLVTVFDHWQFDIGFHSQIWPCYDEWQECEGKMDDICDATFVSVWDGGYEVATPCKVNMRTKEVFNIEVFDGVETFVNELDAEFVRFTDGTECDVVERDSVDGFWYA